ncbi:hypothetical protein HYFRA_00012263 [Hymenoscyphus fraxineus]|uniref:Serine hydrolase domain-containing protein n=1 Tax=Hymenoscyphus fraxineus TaxID=746836 RepID=A0A9N9PK65_9HELO|nr:hypothetical protein HYFRA_00012263 [Hymenoscyphus fraxineus]
MPSAVREKMRFLCLPGAYGSAKDYWADILQEPFCQQLTADDSAEFFFTQGQIECPPPVGFEDYFGPKPLYKFFDYDGIQKNNVLERVRDFPEGETPEDVLRELMPQGDSSIRQNISNALSAIYRTMDEHGPFDGICAYSEGTVAAGCLIMEEAKLFASEGRPRRIKRAVFFAGWPPLDSDSNTMVLVDNTDDVIDIPTLHCVGADDPYLAGAMALFNVCDQDNAILFDHGKGHTIPRDKKTLKELGDAVRVLAEL